MILQGIALGSLQPDEPSVPFGTDVLAKREIVFPFAARIYISLKSSIDPAAAGLEAHFTKWEEKQFPPNPSTCKMENPATKQLLKRGLNDFAEPRGLRCRHRNGM